MSRDHSIPSLESENFLLPYCRLKAYKMRMVDGINEWGVDTFIDDEGARIFVSESER